MALSGQKTKADYIEWGKTSKHYVNKKEVAKEMVKNGFRIFKLQDKKTLQKDTPVKKEGLTSL